MLELPAIALRSALLSALAAPKPSPSPSSNVDPDTVTPGLIGFAVFAVIAIVAILLILDMVRRIRRVNARYRARERIAAELREPPVPDDDDPEASDAGRDPERTRNGRTSPPTP